MDEIHFRTAPFEWTCGHCGITSSVPPDHYHSGYRKIAVQDPVIGGTVLVHSAITCPNTRCRELTLAVRLALQKPSLGHAYPIETAGETLRDWMLLPDDEKVGADD